MGRGSRFQESDATDEENSYNYRIEWDDIIHVDFDYKERHIVTEHHGPGSRTMGDFDNAWDAFNDCRDNPDFVGVRLIKIASDGSETVYAS